MPEVFKGATDVTLYFALRDSTTGAAKTGVAHTDVTGSYARMRGNRTAISMANLAAPDSAHSDGGWEEVDATNQPGLYRFDPPDAAFATGADKVVVTVKATGAITEHLLIELIDWNKQVAAVPNAAAGANGGLPTADANNGVKLRDGTGAGEIDLVSGKVLLQDNAVTFDAIASSGADYIADKVWDESTSGHLGLGTYGQALQPLWTTIVTAATNNTVTLNTAPQPDNYFVGQYVMTVGGTGEGQVRRITAFVNATGVLTVTPNWTTNPDTSTEVVILTQRAEADGSGLSAADVWGYGGGRTLSSFGTLVSDITTAVWAAGTRTLTGFGTLIADIWANATRTITGGTITTYTGNTPQTGDAYARLGAPAGASIAADIATRASQTSVDDVDNLVDTEVAAILAAVDTEIGALTTNLATANTNISTISTNVSTVLNRIGAFAGSGVNTILGFLKALGSKASSLTPSDMGGTYDNTTDSLEAIRDRGDAEWGGEGGGGGGATAAEVWAYASRTLTQSSAQIAATVSGTTITLQRGDSLSIALTGLGSLTGNTKLWFGAKSDLNAVDATAELLVERTAGLLYIHGQAPASAGSGVVTVDDAGAGNITITVDEVESRKLTKGRYTYEVQSLISGNVRTHARGLLIVQEDAIRSVS